jgi:hypothetical protein
MVADVTTDGLATNELVLALNEHGNFQGKQGGLRLLPTEDGEPTELQDTHRAGGSAEGQAGASCKNQSSRNTGSGATMVCATVAPVPNSDCQWAILLSNHTTEI